MFYTPIRQTQKKQKKKVLKSLVSYPTANLLSAAITAAQSFPWGKKEEVYYCNIQPVARAVNSRYSLVMQYFVCCTNTGYVPWCDCASNAFCCQSSFRSGGPNRKKGTRGGGVEWLSLRVPRTPLEPGDVLCRY